MKILLIEDEDEKYQSIASVLAEVLAKTSHLIKRARSFNGAQIELSKLKFDLVIGDLIAPQRDSDSEPIDIGDQLLEVIEHDSGARFSRWIVLSRYENAAAGARSSFAKSGVSVISYDDEGSWKRVLSERIRGISGACVYDFCVVCALSEERSGFGFVENAVVGDRFRARGLDCQEVTIDGFVGLVVVPSRMGLVEAAITSARVVDFFRPKVVAMSGICGGVSSNAGLGDVVLVSQAWNYQSGKIKGGGFSPEPTFVSIPEKVRVVLSQLVESDQYGVSFRRGLVHSDVKTARLLLAPMASGSQVVADSAALDGIAAQHRKVAGIDMEMFGTFSAVSSFYEESAVFFGVKTVVDLADAAKADSLHEYGGIVSARVVSHIIPILLRDLR